jgi:hypothetical protein
VRILSALAIFKCTFACALLATMGILRPMPFPRSQVGRKTGVCTLLATFSLCVGILQFISVELFTFSFCVGIMHIISVEHFYGAKILGEVGGCCSDEENDRRRLWGRGMRPLLCARMRLAPALALKTRFAIGHFAPLEGQIPPSKGRAHAAPALCKNTLFCCPNTQINLQKWPFLYLQIIFAELKNANASIRICLANYLFAHADANKFVSSRQIRWWKRWEMRNAPQL